MSTIISLIISIISIILSLYNFVVNLITRHRRINIRIERFYIRKSYNDMTVKAYISFENLSQLPISITRLQIKAANELYDCDFFPDYIGETSMSSGNEIYERKYFYTIKTPVNIPALGAVKEWFAFTVPIGSILDDDKVLEFNVCTNRGKSFIKKFLINTDTIIT